MKTWGGGTCPRALPVPAPMYCEVFHLKLFYLICIHYCLLHTCRVDAGIMRQHQLYGLMTLSEMIDVDTLAKH